jgi:hypothetical protein
MNEKQFRELCDWAQKRDDKFYAWVRWLILLASGSLTVLVSLQPVQNFPPLSSCLLRMAMAMLAQSILLGSLVSYGEIWIEREKVRRLQEQRKLQVSNAGDESPSPIVVAPPAWIRKIEQPFYISLILAVLLLTALAILR